MSSVAENIISFNQSLRFAGKLPAGIRIMNPFRENPEAARVSAAFYRKYYNDHRKRHLILGINPGRFGAGLTGVPFTDPKRLKERCGIAFNGPVTHEPSSVFIYDVINTFGGEAVFYRNFYINSVFPLGFTKGGATGKQVNYNYYDSAALTAAIHDAAVGYIRKQISFGMHTDVCICLGTGKNMAFLNKVNEENHLFDQIIPLEHPRYIMQYRLKKEQAYVNKYREVLQRLILND